MSGIWEHFTSSYAIARAAEEQRKVDGTQPVYPLIDHQFLLYANVFYLGFTLVLYKYMQGRERFACESFKSILLVYNCICVALAAYVVWGIGSVLFADNIPRKFVCNDLVIPGSAEDVDGHANKMAFYFWIFYIQKFWEYMDTWFFILRKSFRQLTFLHIFHHASITIVAGSVYHFDFNGDMYLPLILNAGVHVLMYSHYLVAALGLPTPWRPWLTSIQLTQFVLIATQSGMSMYRGDSCGAPYFAKVVLVIYMGSMLILFGNFFFQAYVFKKDQARFGARVVKRVDPIEVTRNHFGRVELDTKGCASVDLPNNFANYMENHYTVMPLGKPMPNLHVCREPTEGQCSFELAGGSPTCHVSYTVTMKTTILGKPNKEPQPNPFQCCKKNLSGDFDNKGNSAVTDFVDERTIDDGGLKKRK